MFRTINRRAMLGASAATMAFTALTPRLARAQGAKPTAPTTPVPSIETFATPAISHIDLSPDGKHFGAIMPNGDQNILVTTEIGTENVKRFGFGTNKVRDVVWADNTHALVLTSVTVSPPEFSSMKSELFQALNLNTANGRVATLFNNQLKGSYTTGTIMVKNGTFYPIVFGGVQRVKVDGAYRITAQNYRMAQSYDMCLFSFAMDDEKGQLLTAGATGTERFVLTPDGDVVAFATNDSFRKEWILAYNAGLGSGHQKFNVVYRQKYEGWGHASLIGLGRDGKSIVVQLPKGDSDQYEYFEMSPEGVLSAPLESSLLGKQGYPLFHPTTFRLAGFGHEGDTTIYDYFDPMMKQLTDALPKMLGESYRAYPVAFAEDPRKMLVYSEGNEDAGSYYYVDFSTGDAGQIAAAYPNLPEEWVTQKQAISYKAADGLEIHGYLTLPPFKDGKNLPLVVLPHGGPQARDTIDFDWQAQILASRGYAVLQPNFRGSDGYGESFVQAGHGEWGRKMQTDLSDGVRYLAGKGIVDLKRVAIMGASYGGYAAMAGATLDPGVYNCSVAIAGVADLKSFVEWKDKETGNMESASVSYWKDFLGDQARWDAASPAKQAAQAYCPILLIHGTDDTVVPIDQSRRMEAALKAAGKPVEFVTYKGQDHWETVSSSRVDMMKAALNFLAKYNPA